MTTFASRHARLARFGGRPVHGLTDPHSAFAAAILAPASSACVLEPFR